MCAFVSGRDSSSVRWKRAFAGRDKRHPETVGAFPRLPKGARQGSMDVWIYREMGGPTSAEASECSLSASGAASTWLVGLNEQLIKRALLVGQERRWSLEKPWDIDDKLERGRLWVISPPPFSPNPNSPESNHYSSEYVHAELPSGPSTPSSLPWGGTSWTCGDRFAGGVLNSDRTRAGSHWDSVLVVLIL